MIATLRMSWRRGIHALAVVLASTTGLFCGPILATTALEVVVVDALDQPLAGVAVSVTVEGTPSRAPKAEAAIAQRNRSFTPATLVIQTGTAVSFPNEDTVRHHVYSFSTINPFEIKLYVGMPSQPVVFDKPGNAVLGCNIHDQMVGYVHVVDTPYFGVTDEKGRATLQVPSGRHKLRAWHPDLTAESPGIEMRVSAGPDAGAPPPIVRLPIE